MDLFVFQVCLSEIDFVSKTTSSREIVIESSKVVQLSYTKQHLLVSTLERTVLVKPELPHPFPVGQRQRKHNGNYGGIFITDTNPKSLQFLAVRPRNTLYHAKPVESGTGVIATILLEELFQRPHLDIPIVNPVIFSRSVSSGEDTASLLEGDIQLLTTFQVEFPILSK